jgi:hypothetical protein
MTTGSTSTIYVGQLALDMNDSTHKDLVWRGVVGKTIDPEAIRRRQSSPLSVAEAALILTSFFSGHQRHMRRHAIVFCSVE